MVLVTLLAPLWGACGQRTEHSAAPPVSGEPNTTTLKSQLQPLPEAASNQPELDEPDLRRGYGIVDMRFDACVKAEGDQALHGEACPGGFLIHGPYVNVPANAEIEVTFDVQPTEAVEVYADIVAQMGKQSLGGIKPHLLEAGIRRTFGYHLNVFRPDSFVESRIGFRSSASVEFLITNYTMTVR
jgi:hypothetical protein